MLGPTSAIAGMGLDKHVALLLMDVFRCNKRSINWSCFTEAMEGGLIAVVKKGDIIQIDINEGKLNIDISDAELEARMKEWKAPEPKITKDI